MRDDIRCEDHAALVGFLYDDCEADERARIRAHLAVCAQCAEELESLSMTREQLSAWTPPDAQLGFRVNPVGVSPARHAAWWSRPLPAWAQLAAAVVIFAAGSLAGLMAGSCNFPPTKIPLFIPTDWPCATVSTGLKPRTRAAITSFDSVERIGTAIISSIVGSPPWSRRAR